MFSKVVICVVASLCAVGAQNFSKLRENNWPYDLVTPFPYRTFSPIDIDTSDVRLINTGCPLKVVNGLFEPHVVTNTGHSISVYVTRPVATTICGGVLGNNVYVFQNLTYFFSGDYRGEAGGSIDDNHYPLQTAITFRNSKYPTLSAALKKRDGFAILVANIDVGGYAPNPLFTPFANILAKLCVSGSSVISQSLPLFQWFQRPLTVQHYYAYPGSYIDSTNIYYTQYDSATIIQFPKSGSPFISIPQFAYFQRLMNPKGTQLTNTETTFPRGCRPVVQACGAVEFLIPTAL